MCSVKILTGDCRDLLPTLPEKSIQACVTSPPYFGLRDYGVEGQIGLEPTVEAFVAEMVTVFREVHRVLADDGTLWLNLGDSYAASQSTNGGYSDKSTLAGFTNANTKGRQSNQSGERRKIAAGVTNLANFLQSQLKGGVLFYGRTDPRGRAAQRVHVLIQDKTAPNAVLQPFLSAKRIRIKDGQNDLCEVGGGLDAPVVCWASSSLCSADPCDTTERVMDVPDNVRIVLTTSNLDTDAPFGIPPAFAVEHGETPFAVEVPSEPVAKGIASGIPALDSLTLNAIPERFTNIDSVDEAVTLLDGADLRTSLVSDFRVRKATSKQVTFDLHRGAELCVQRVGHLSLLRDGIIPYRSLLDEATARRNEMQPKQELGIPEMVKRALMRDGWICRQTIIWAKPNSMPESVRDRCTKSHEYLFLLTKSPSYYFDAAAISEPVTPSTVARLSQPNLANQVGSTRVPGKTNGAMKAVGGGYRNRRSVWTIEATGNRERECLAIIESDLSSVDKLDAIKEMMGGAQSSVWRISTQGFKDAHFATFPEALVEPCILAGSREGDTILDPFFGAGTVGMVTSRLGRDCIGIELNDEYAGLARRRIVGASPMFNQVTVQDRPAEWASVDLTLLRTPDLPGTLPANGTTGTTSSDCQDRGFVSSGRE